MLDEDALGVVAVGERLETQPEAEPVVVGVEPFGREARAKRIQLLDERWRSLGRCDEVDGFHGSTTGTGVGRWVGWTSLALA